MGEFDKYIDGEITREDALEILKVKGNKIMELLSAANKTREKYCGNEFHSCTITNAKSGKCKENCRFCAQSAHWDTTVQTYEMKSLETLMEEYKRARETGAEHFDIVTSGKRLEKGTKEFDTIIEFLRAVRGDNFKFCASVGLVGEEEAKILKAEGLSRYHNNIQTAVERYGEIVATTHSVEDRIGAIKNAKNAGLEVCCGGIIGMGETIEDRVSMVFTLKELGVDSVPINILNPIKGTPMEAMPILAADEAIKMVALLRLVLKDKIIKIAAGRDNILKDFMGTIFMAGANGMLVGGYLTIRGRSVEEDLKFVENIQRMWGAAE